VPSLYKNNFAGVRTGGQASLDGFVRGRYDNRHMPAYHVSLGIKDGSFQYPDLPMPVKNINLSLLADNPDGVPDHAEVNISRGHIEMGDAPLDFRLLVKTPVSDPWLDLAAKGQLDLGKVQKFVKLESGTRLAGLLNADMSMKGSLSAMQDQKIGQFDAAGTLALTGFAYSSAAYPSGIGLDRVLMSFNPKNITLSELKGVYGKTHFSAHGALNNLPVFMLKHKPLDGSLTVQADEVNINELMGGSTSPAATTDTAAATRATTAFAMPANIDFVLSAAVDRVLYDRLLLEQVTGRLVIADQTVTLQNVKAKGLDGTLAINGAYSTKNGVQHPEIAFSYDVQQLDVQKTYAAFVSMQQLMPAAKYIAGKFSSQLTLDGRLGPDMRPDMGTLSGAGRLSIANGALKGFAPTDQLAQTLHLDELKEIALKDIQTSFAIKNGRVIVEPFPVRVKDIEMEVGGSHGFDQTLDYTVGMKLPRAMLGGDVNRLIRAVNPGSKDKIELPVGIGGTVTKPTIRADIKGALAGAAAGLKQQATDLVRAKVDSAKQQLRDTVRAAGQQAARNAAEELRRRLTGQKDSGVAGTAEVDTSTKKRLQSAGKSLLDGLFNKKKSN
ncbi:MAG: AsmA-like C-terminal region-containing protein, partial [Bacteroidetes bacterium]|nr:AsmA-like C-terminal region-containing protein [Bacteroidota bacterium]